MKNNRKTNKIIWPPLASRKWFRRLFIFFHIAFDVALVGYALFGISDYIFFSGQRERQNIALLPIDLVETSAYRKRQKPANLEVKKITVINRQNDFDLVGVLQNPNTDWYAVFSYEFIWSEGQNSPEFFSPLAEENLLETPPPTGQTVKKTSFILPGEEKIFSSLVKEAVGRPKEIKLEITDIGWKKINKHEIPDYLAWSSARLNLQIKEPNFSQARFASFIVHNQTDYDYKQVGFQVTLLRGSSIVGINSVMIENLLSGEQRSLSVSWSEPVQEVTKMEITPEVEIFTPDNYL